MGSPHSNRAVTKTQQALHQLLRPGHFLCETYQAGLELTEKHLPLLPKCRGLKACAPTATWHITHSTREWK